MNGPENPNQARKIGDWPPLFSLWVWRDQCEARLHPELAEKQRILRRGWHNNEEIQKLNKTAETLIQVLPQIAAAFRTPAFKADFAVSITDGLIASVGEPLARLFYGGTAGSERAAEDCLKILKRALEGATKDKEAQSELLDPAVVINAKLSQGEVAQQAQKELSEANKALLAIEEAQSLCEDLRRLPTKSELLDRMETIGVKYSSKSKGARANWAETFRTAGLDALPE